MFWKNQVQLEQNAVGSGIRVAGAVKSLVNARDLQLECASLALNIAYACCETCYGKRRDLDCMKHCLCLFLYIE